MKIQILIPVLLFSAGFISCNKSENAEFTDTPIVESYLRPGEFPQVKVRRQIPFSSNVTYSGDDLNSLSIQISNSTTSTILKPSGDGVYTDKTFSISEGQRYDLSFVYNSKTVSAYTKVPVKPVNYKESVTSMGLVKTDSTSGPPNFGSMPEPLNLTWDNSDGSYYIVVIENMAATLVPIRNFGNREPPGNRFKKAPTTASGLEIRPMEFQYFGEHRLILYHVLPDYASLYTETQSSSQNLTNPSTSIVNGYGIFTALNSDTLYINIYQLNKK